MTVLTEEEKSAALENLKERLKSIGFQEIKNVHGLTRVVLPGFNVYHDYLDESEEN